MGWGREELAEGEKKGMGIYRAHPKVPELLTPSLNHLVSGNQLERKRLPSLSSGSRQQSWPRHLARGARAIRLYLLSPPVLKGSGTTLPSETFKFLCPQSVNFRGSGVARGQQTRRGRP